MPGGAIAELEVSPGVQLAPVDVARLSGVRIKAYSLQALEAVVTARFGPEVFATWRASLDPDLSAGAVTWVPVEYRYHLVEQLVARFCAGDARSAWGLGAQVAQREINGLFRFVMRFTEPSLVLGLSSRFWRAFYDRSEFAVVDSGPGFVRAEVREWPLTNAVVAYELAGALCEWLRWSTPGVALDRLAWLAPGVLRLEASW